MEFLLVGVLVAIALFALASAIRRWWTERRPVRTSSLGGLERTVEAVVQMLNEIAEPAGRGSRAHNRTFGGTERIRNDDDARR